MVRERGLEPPRPKPHAPKACVSTIPPLARIGIYLLKFTKEHEYLKDCLNLGSLAVVRQRRVSVTFRLVHHNNSINGRR